MSCPKREKNGSISRDIDKDNNVTASNNMNVIPIRHEYMNKNSQLRRVKAM